MTTTVPFVGTESYKAYMMNKDNDILLKDFNNWLRSTDISQYTEKWGM